jgi:hypothetical protein
MPHVELFPSGGVRNVPTLLLDPWRQPLGPSQRRLRVRGATSLLRSELRDLRLSLDPILLKRFSLFPVPLLNDPQPRKTNGEDHHDDQNGILYHWSALS